MAMPSPLNPLGYVINRSYTGSADIKNKLFQERLAKARNLYRKDLLAHYGCVNAIEFSEEGELLVSGGDDRRVLLWSVPDAVFGHGSPFTLLTSHASNIFCLAFDSTNSKIFSGGNDDQVIMHDARTGHLVIRLLHRKPIYGLSLNPQNDYILATAGDDGRVLIYDLRDPSSSDPVCLAKQKTGFHSVKFNPSNPHWLVTANSEEGIVLWDSRKPKEQLIHYDSNAGQVSGISACFNSKGTHLLALRRRLPPVLYETQNESAICQFYHPNYYNSCTMKTCSFAGAEDEYVLSGSDDFNLYMWRIPKDNAEWGSPHVVLHGHRSIVNQVIYNKHNNLIATSGVEKMIKLWSTLPFGNWSGSLLKEHMEMPRSVYSHDDYVYLVGHGERISHDYSDHSTQEDSKMMAFFDSLIQREIEGWESPSDDSHSSNSDSDGHNEDFLNFQRTYFNRKDELYKRNKQNRIAQLISQKRNRLAKMAHGKCSSSIKRYGSKEKLRKRKLHQKGNPSKYTKNSSVSKKSAGKYNNTLSHTPEKDNRKQRMDPEKGRLRKYRTRQSLLHEICDSNTSNNSFDAPSTSTGITGSSNSVFRIIEQDSDEDVPTLECTESQSNLEENLVNILPTPLNGTQDMYINALEITNGNVVTVRNEEYVNATSSNRSFDEGRASTSSNGVCRYSEGPSNGKIKDYVNNSSYLHSSESDSEYEYNYHTPSPNKKRRSSLNVPDSGCASGPCSSNGSYSRKSARNSGCSTSFNNDNDDDYNVTFKKRVKKAKLNIRKHIGADSDSN